MSAPHHRYRLEELEPRLLLSADVGAVISGALDAPPPSVQAAELDPGPAESIHREIAFVDRGVDGYERLVSDLAAEHGSRMRIVLLDSDRDGLEQINGALAGQANLAAMHVFSHGNADGLQIGATWLDLDGLAGEQAQIGAWGDALVEGADVLLYGCNLASTADGRSLVGELASLTGADVAASSDLSGHGSDANWTLEFQAGDIEAAPIFQSGMHQAWASQLLVAVNDTTTATSSGANLSFSHMSAGSDRLLLVGISMNLSGSNVVNSVTFNGDSLSQVGTVESGDARVELWSLVAPDVGTHTLSVTLDSASDGNTVGAMTFTGVHQTTPLGEFFSDRGAATSGAVAVPSAANDPVFGAISVASSTDFDLTPDAPANEEWDLFDSDANGGGTTSAGTSSVGVGWSWASSESYALGAVSIKDVNSPLVVLPGGTVSYTEGDGATLVDAAATVSDPDSGDFDTGALTVDFAVNGTANDRLAINNQGVGVGNIAVSGSSVTYDFGGGPVSIGTVAGGTDGFTPLVVTLNANADSTAVQALARNVTYEDVSSEDPWGPSRVVRFVVTDGDGGRSSEATQTVDVTATANNTAPTFTITGGDGQSTTAIGGSADNSWTMALQPDGKIILAGTSSNGVDNDVAVARYNVDGSLDTSFGGVGFVTTAIGGNDIGDAVVVQSDGKIVVGGRTHNGTDWDFLVVRYNTDGSLDTSFDGDGIVTTDLGGNERGRGVTLQTDGKILVIGGVGSGTSTDYGVVRYLSNGMLDASFDGDGVVTTDFDARADEPYVVTMQADGRILVGGYSINPGTARDFSIARYLADGTLDPSFNGVGTTRTALSTGWDIAYRMAVQPDGKIVLAGQTTNGVDNDFALVRYNADGTLDTSFSGDGIQTTDLAGSGDVARSLAVQADGKILVAGYGAFGGTNDFAIVRYNTNGAVDTTFDGDGVLTTALGAGDETGTSILLQADGKILLGGHTNNGVDNDFAVLRYSSDGTLDPLFDSTTSLDATPAFVEDGAIVGLDSGVEVHDAELDARNGGLGNYHGASVTLVRSGGASSVDEFSFGDGNGISLVAGNLIKSGQVIATFDTSTTTGQLVVTFTDANGQTPTSIDVNNILSQLTYANGSDAPATSVQIDWTFNDGNGTSQGDGGALTGTGSVVVAVTPTNDSPVVSLSTGAASFTKGDSATAIDAGANVTDGDLLDFDAGVLTVSVSANGTASDRLAISDQGVGAGNIATSGANVTYDFGSGAVTIGSFVGGTDGSTPLVITLNSNATAAAVQALARNLTFENSSEDPSELTRTVSFALTDGDGGTSSTVAKSVQVSAGNDEPLIYDQQFRVSQGSSTGAWVGAVFASDPDADALTYSIVAGNPGNAFVIDSSSGVLSVGNSTALQGVRALSLIVQVEDGEGLASQASISIMIDEVMGAQPVEAETEIAEEPEPEATQATSEESPTPDSSGEAAPATPLFRSAEVSPPEAFRPVFLTAEPGAESFVAPLDNAVEEAVEAAPVRAAEAKPQTKPETPELTEISPAPSLEFDDELLAALDAMGDQLSDATEQETREGGFSVGAIEAASIAFTAGFVAWVLRAGSLITALLSSLPIWTQLDPLPVLAASRKERKRLEKEAQSIDEQEQAVASLVESADDEGVSQ